MVLLNCYLIEKLDEKVTEFHCQGSIKKHTFRQNYKTS